MHRRVSFAAAGWLLLASLASAQQPAELARDGGPSKRRITLPTRDAGTYHVSTGTWTRSGSRAPLGPDIIYRNDHPSGYFGVGWEGAQGVDEGKLPGTGHPIGVPRDAYQIDGFRFSYCSQSASSVDWEHYFYDSYVPCDDPDMAVSCLNLVKTISLSGLPSASSCWIVTVDLAGGSEFCMVADGGPCAPGYQGGGLGLDHFGWGTVWNTTDGAFAGPVLSGSPFWAPHGEGTCYDPALTCAAGATGLGAQDLFGIGTPFNGCYFFGGWCISSGCGAPIPTPCAQFDLILYTDCNETCAPGSCEDARYCSPAVPNSTGAAGRVAIDRCSLGTAPVVSAADLPRNQFGYLLIGTGTQVISAPPGSIGDLCLGGAPIGRYTADVTSSGAFGELRTDLVHGNTGAGTGQLPNPPGGVLAAGQTWNLQYWFRDGMTSNFTDAITVTFVP